MSTLKKLLAQREQRWRKEMQELAFNLHSIGRPSVTMADVERAKSRYSVAQEDRAWALRGFTGTRPRLGVDIHTPFL